MKKVNNCCETIRRYKKLQEQKEKLEAFYNHPCEASPFGQGCALCEWYLTNYPGETVEALL